MLTQSIKIKVEWHEVITYVAGHTAKDVLSQTMLLQLLRKKCHQKSCKRFLAAPLATVLATLLRNKFLATAFGANFGSSFLGASFGDSVDNRFLATDLVTCC